MPLRALEVRYIFNLLYLREFPIQNFHRRTTDILDRLKYQYGHMMLNANARTVCSRQETFNSNTDMRHDLATFNSHY